MSPLTRKQEEKRLWQNRLTDAQNTKHYFDTVQAMPLEKRKENLKRLSDNYGWRGPALKKEMKAAENRAKRKRRISDIVPRKRVSGGEQRTY